MYERFKKLCDKKGVSMKTALDDLRIANGIVANWKARNSLPSGQTAMKIADYFGVTLDEVLGRKPIEPDYSVNLSDDEKMIIETIRHSDAETRERIIQYIDFVNAMDKNK